MPGGFYASSWEKVVSKEEVFSYREENDDSLLKGFIVGHRRGISNLLPLCKLMCFARDTFTRFCPFPDR